MAGMWIDTRIRSRMYRAGRRPGLLRGILNIAEAIREEVGESEGAEEEELKRLLNDSGGALVVPRGELRVARVPGEEGDGRERGWRRRLTKGSTF